MSSIKHKMYGPGEAMKLLEEDSATFQRFLSEKHVQMLKRAMLAGEFIQEATKIVIATDPDGRKYLCNGQHTLRAIIASGCPLKLATEFVDVIDEGDAKKLYASIDRGRGRGISVIYSMYGLEDLFGVNKSMVGSIGASVKLICGQMKRAKSGIADFELLSAIQDFAPQISTWIDIYDRAVPELRKKFKRTDVMATGLVTLRWFDGDAEEFWRVVSGEKPAPNNDDPRAVYGRTLLLTVPYSSKSSSTSGLRAYSKLGFIKLAVLAWNKWVDGETSIARIVIRNEYLTEGIKGTPFEKSDYEYISPAGAEVQAMLKREAGEDDSGN